ncbi:adenosylcobinamide-phosphate synthase CbiB [Variovorax sp. HJSM1_2]|uniref:adenosylcobinamide-phosphate synthase CbiB n=1 Tax=Variovorax sp. HJSM1_2 TaxID=3366263 RepID=UPI003BC22BD5
MLFVLALDAPWLAAALAWAVLVALALDLLWGEPPVRWHPVVWMGNWLAWAGRMAAPLLDAPGAASQRFKPFMLGALFWCAGAALFSIAAWGLQSVLWAGLQQVSPGLAVLLGGTLLGILLKPMLAWRMLRDEVLAVEVALEASLEAGRHRLGGLVSRDVSTLDATAVRESAIESLAENLNDSVLAPLCWFVLLGLPGAVLYRFANTADAMWGYRGPRAGRLWEWAGKWAARADDVLSWWPARWTALLMWLVTKDRHAFAWRSCWVEARKTPSPNSGWPMAAMALLLGVALRKPGVYVLYAQGAAPLPEDTFRARDLAQNVVWAQLVCAAGLLFLLGF